MTNNNIIDFLGEEYIDYLDTIPDVQLKKVKDSIYSKAITLDLTEKFYDYIVSRLPIDSNYISVSLLKFSYSNDGITVSGIKFMEKIADLNSKFSDNGFFTNFVTHCSLIPTIEYVYSKYRAGKCDKPIPVELEMKKHYSFSKLDIYLWVYKMSSTKQISQKDKVIFVHQIIEKEFRYNSTTELNIIAFRDIFKRVEISEQEYFDIKNYDDAKTRVLSVLRCCDEYFFSWYLNSMNISNHKFFNKDNFDYMVKNLINYGLSSNGDIIGKIRIILSWAKMLDYKLSIDCPFKYEIKHAVSSFDSDSKNEELIYEIINLGAIPPKGNKFYDYYKQISIIE